MNQLKPRRQQHLFVSAYIMRDKLPVTYNLLSPFKYKPWFSQTMSVLLAFSLIATIALISIIVVNIPLFTNFSTGIVICLILPLFYIFPKIEDVWLYKTSIIGQIKFDKDSIKTNDIIYNYKDFKSVVLRNNFTTIKTLSPTWKMSKRFEIAFNNDEKITFYISCKLLKDSDQDLSDTFDDIRKLNMYLYRHSDDIS